MEELFFSYIKAYLKEKVKNNAEKAEYSLCYTG